MPYDHRNLANTIPAGQSEAAKKYRRMQRCKVWREKKYPPFFVLAGEPHEKWDSHTNYHEWDPKTGRCRHCNLTRAEAREPGIRELKRLAREKAGDIAIKKPRRLARDIARTPGAEIPPIRFIGRI